jgi:hypothetical protein
MSTRKSILTGSALALIGAAFMGLSAFGVLALASDRIGWIPGSKWPRIGAEDASAGYGISWTGDRVGTEARDEPEAKHHRSERD